MQIHRRQAATNSRLIGQAEGKGQLRLAENLRRVQANLDRIIPALEAPRTAVPAMNRADNSSSLAQANARRHQAALTAAHHAIDQLRREGKPVNYAAVAYAADVSRTWLYSQEQIRDLISDFRKHEPPAAALAAQTTRAPFGSSFPAGAGQQAVHAWQATNAAVLHLALSTLPEPQRRALTAAVPAIEALAKAIDRLADTPPADQDPGLMPFVFVPG